MAYKLSDRHGQDKISASNNDPDTVDLGKVATVFIVFGLLSLLTAFIYSIETQGVANTSFRPTNAADNLPVIGPINIRKDNETYVINVKAALSSQSWSYIGGDVLDANKEYLFSFGKELSYYSGRDWTELDNEYSMNVTFPKSGTYYLKFNTDNSRNPKKIVVKVGKKLGSSIPHMWFGIILLIIGIVMNEIKNRTIKNVIDKIE